MGSDLKAREPSMTREKRQALHLPRNWGSDIDIVDIGRTLLFKGYSPPALLVNEDRELIHVYGEAQNYLRIPEGTIWSAIFWIGNTPRKNCN